MLSYVDTDRLYFESAPLCSLETKSCNSVCVSIDIAFWQSSCFPAWNFVKLDINGHFARRCTSRLSAHLDQIWRIINRREKSKFVRKTVTQLPHELMKWICMLSCRNGKTFGVTDSLHHARCVSCLQDSVVLRNNGTSSRNPEVSRQCIYPYL